MEPFTILLIAIGLAMDCFAVSIAAGAREEGKRCAALIALPVSFGVFQFGMNLAGWYAGDLVAGAIGGLDHWIAFALLAVIGIRMVREGLEGERCSMPETDYLALAGILVLSVATSIDSLGAGLGLAFLDGSIVLPALTIGLTSLIFSFAGMLLGSRLCGMIGKRAEVLGGLILLGIGVKILVEHMY